MQAMFNADGTIRKVYDESLHRHPESTTVNITQEQANTIALYRVNPQTKELYLLPTCEQKYIKIVGNVFLEMSTEEKAVVDNQITQQAATSAAIQAVQEARGKAIADNLPSWAAVETAINTADTVVKLRAIVLKLARVEYWLAKNKAE
jgi:exosome complex RNA-binding protein Rrp42 (RNase PH superfamily)